MHVRSVPTRALAVLAAASLATAACSSPGEDTVDRSATSVVVGSAAFSESLIVASIYAGALRGAGYQVVLRKRVGPREVYLPALQEGGPANGVDLVPEYVGTMLEFVNRNAGEASGDLEASLGHLRSHLDPLGLTVLEPSRAAREYAFAVTRATSERLGLRRLSDLTPVADQLTLGAAPDCRARAFCLPGLDSTYGVRFKEVRTLDAGGPRTLDALTGGGVDVGQVVTSDGGLAGRDLVVLEDDKHLQTVDNLVPVIRNDVLNDDLRAILNEISAGLTNEDLIDLNKRADVDSGDPEVLARDWLQQHGFPSG